MGGGSPFVVIPPDVREKPRRPVNLNIMRENVSAR